MILMGRAIGLLELNNITQGYQAADKMLKASNVQILEATSVCPGKFIIIVAGDVGAVKSSLDSAVNICTGSLIDKHIIPNVHEGVFPAISGTSTVKSIKALGIIETYSVVSAIIAGDTAIKAAQIELIEIRLARGMGGKALITMTGDVGAVTSAVEAGSNAVLKSGLLADKLVIPSPHKDLHSKIM